MKGDVEESLSALFYVMSLFCLATIVLGGINTNDIAANVILQFFAIPIIAVVIYRLLQGISLSRSTRSALIALGLGLLVPLIQLIPLPEPLWCRLPFRDLTADGLALLGAAGGGMLSLAPFLTWVSYLALLPALAIFLAVITFNARERTSFVVVFNGMAILSAFLGLLQFSQNSSQGAYLYPEGPGDVVGFFANQNHFAALMYGSAPFAAALLLVGLVPNREQSGEARSAGLRLHEDLNSRAPFASLDLPNWGIVFGGAASFFVLVVACIMARSRAGVVLLMLTLVAVSFLPNWRNLQVARGKRVGSKALATLAGFSVLFALEYGFSRLLMRFEADPLQDARISIAKNVFAAAIKAWPMGTGIGTFPHIYSAVEPVRDIIPYMIVNHAHNDYLEFLLEGGLPALIIIVVFLLWYAACSSGLWFSRVKDSSSYLGRAASITIALLLLHSAVDYPLRTHAVMGLFALCCALLLPVPSRSAPSGAKLH